MKIVHIISGLAPDGAETMLYQLLQRMDGRRFESLVVSLTSGGSMAPLIEALGIQVLEPGVGLIAKLLRWRPNLLQGWMYHGNLAALTLAALLPGRIPVVWNVRGSHHILRHEKRGTALAIEWNALLSGLPYRIVNNSAASARLHEAHLRFASGHWEIIPNGFDLDRFAPSAAARRDLRAELQIPSEAVLIGLIGRYHPMKDHENFMRAAALLTKSAPDAYFLLAGPGCDSSNAILTTQIAAAGIASCTHVLGARTDMPRIAAALDIATSASYSEGFPNVVGEAMSSGVPCVVTDVGDSAWLVGNSGLVVPPRDAGSLADGWQRLIAGGPEGRRKLGRLGRERIAAHFSISAVAARYEQLYEQALEQEERSGYRQCAA